LTTRELTETGDIVECSGSSVAFPRKLVTEYLFGVRATSGMEYLDHKKR